MKNGVSPPRLSTVSRKYSVNRKGAVESVWQPLYHYQDVPSGAFPSQLTYFQNPVGSGGLTFADTNVESAGQMPAPKEMLVTNIQIALLPDLEPGRAAGDNTNWNDVYNVSSVGHLSFFIGSKVYLNEAPLGRFPVQNRLAGTGDNGGGAFQNDYAVTAGRVYEITPIRLMSNQNFSVTLNFPGTPPTVISNMRIGVILGGFQYRLSQ